MARVNTKQVIADAAVQVAAQHGISGASMDEIAQAAGVAKGSLYYNFASKDAIFEAVIRRGFEALSAVIEAARSGAGSGVAGASVAPRAPGAPVAHVAAGAAASAVSARGAVSAGAPPYSGASFPSSVGDRQADAPVDAVRAVAAATLITLRAQPDLARIMASEAFRTDRPWYEALEFARGSVIVQYRDVLRDAHLARGGAPDRCEEITETAGAALFGSLAGACLDWLLFRPDQPLDAVLDQVLCVGGLG